VASRDYTCAICAIIYVLTAKPTGRSDKDTDSEQKVTELGSNDPIPVA